MTEILTKNDISSVIKRLKSGEVGILPSDTIYGLHCLYKKKSSVNKIRRLKGREYTKPFITLISYKKDLDLFGVIRGNNTKKYIDKYWPGNNTLIFDTKNGDTVALRLPIDCFIKEVIKKTGPLVSTSANKEGEPYFKNIEDAYSLFEDKVDFYVDIGSIKSKPSSIYKIEQDRLTQIR